MTGERGVTFCGKAKGARGVELWGFCLWSVNVIFESSRVEGGGEGHGQKVGFHGGEEVSGDHGIGINPSWGHGKDDLEPSSRGPRPRGGPGSTRLSFICAVRNGIQETAPPWAVYWYRFVFSESSSIETFGGSVVDTSPPCILDGGNLRSPLGAGDKADANIV